MKVKTPFELTVEKIDIVLDAYNAGKITLTKMKSAASSILQKELHGGKPAENEPTPEPKGFGCPFG
jgi:hypothetical protein